MSCLIGNVCGDWTGVFQSAQNAYKAFWEDPTVKTLYNTGKKQVSDIKGIGNHLKIFTLWARFSELGQCIPIGMEQCVASLRGAAGYVTGFSAFAAMVDTVERVSSKVAGFATLNATEDQCARAMSVAGLICYLHSRVFLTLNCLENVIKVPALQGFTQLVSDPNMYGLMLGGVCQGIVAGVRIVTLGASFMQEKDTEISQTANAVKDWFLFGEGICMVLEAGAVMFAVANPWAVPVCQAAGLTFKLLQIWAVPLVNAHYKDVSST
ncbi:MAG: hypothetical protein FJZ58_07465 [Chlamydiae bacterium]|nr:hypothetical protein [Chlamydiota bacterium]